MKKLIAIIGIGLALCATASTQTSKEYVDKKDAEVLERAKTFTEEHVIDFEDWTRSEIGKIEEIADQAKTNANLALEKASRASEDAERAVKNMYHGAARPLPAYLHALTFDDTYPEDAAWWYARADYSNGGGCSARRTGGVLERNYDFPFDDVAEFVVGVSATTNRFASLGVANVGQDLTEAFVTSGKPSRFYKCLPGHTLDGINENGLAVVVNITTTSGVWRTTGEVHCLGAVRWALDHGVTAGATASNLAAKVYVPAGFGANFHYMVADAAETWIVENGEARKVDGVAVMTNFSADRIGGEGYERWTNLVNGASITSQWWTAAYDRNTRPIRVSDIGANYAQVWDAWDAQPREAHRGQRIGGIPWWQTVHTSVYDLTNRVLRICVQEQDDWYVFQVPSSGGVKPETVKEIVEPMIGSATNGIPEEIAALQDGKRDMTDLKITEPKNVHWVWTSDRTSDESKEFLKFANGYSSPKPVLYVDYWVYIPGGKYDGTGVSGRVTDLTLSFRIETDGDLICIATATRASATDTTPVEVDSIALVSQLPSAAQLLTAEQRAEIAKVKDKADEFTEWVPDEDAPSDLVGQPELQVFSPTTVWLQWHTERGVDYNSDPLTPEFEDTEVTFRGDGVLGSFTATRKRVLRTGDAATPQELTNAISTNNPAFVSAVRDTPAPEPGQGEDPPWGTWGTVGAAIAGLVAALKMTVKKIKCGTMPEITPTNGVADVSDFFSESNSLLTGTIAAKSVTEYSSTLTYEVGEIVMRDGVAYKCVTAITTVEAWTAAHWTAATDAEIAARLKGFKDDGSVTDAFAAGLLGKQVANAKVRYALATTASAAMADRTVNLYEMNGNGTITFPTATTHEGVTYARDFLLRVKVTTAGSLTLPTDVTPLGDSFDFTKANDWLIAFTEIGKDANNKAEFYIRAISLEG